MATVPRRDATESTTGPTSDDQPRDRATPRLRLVHSTTTLPEPRKRKAASRRTQDEAGTTTAEYTVVTAAAVAFGALLLKLLTGSWGERILETAFREVIKMLGF
ncbi:MAG: hypothetical protein JWO46_487 [Nocardioidaceae bacterium]|nr:hypothetical protein [Nocardioidaceae bacterium]